MNEVMSNRGIQSSAMNIISIYFRTASMIIFIIDYCFDYSIKHSDFKM